MSRYLGALAGLVALIAIVVVSAGRGGFGSHEAPGVVSPRAVPASGVMARESARSEAARSVGAPADKQILFGDFHVHTTFSTDAFLLSLPLLAGEGAHPPADACDYARHCSGLDFWSINDHAEGITPRHWRETVESIRQCNDVAGDAADPDLVSFLGWEWTQVGTTPVNHYGHKNVVLAHTDAERIPARPIAARPVGRNLFAGPGLVARALISLFGGDDRYDDFARYLDERARMTACPDGVPVRELPDDCHESTATPGELFAKLDDWGFESIVIPHGTTWGLYTPAGSTWDKQLSAAQHDSARQTLVEVFSGHGSSEPYRPWRAVRHETDADAQCPEPTADYLPSCWRAGEIIRARCLAAAEGAAECEGRAAEARANYVAAGAAGHLTVPGTDMEDWLDAGQCRDCFLPAFNYRPGGSVQYMLAISNFDDPQAPRRFRFGFLASSDNHTARPGTGYKEIDRRELTEATGAVDAEADAFLSPDPVEPAPRSQPFDLGGSDLQAFQIAEFERQASFFTTGGLVAVHAAARDREAIWRALDRREVYGTSGDRILLWFDLLNAPHPSGRLESAPMGSELTLGTSPVFEVRAVGAFHQQPGCPAQPLAALDADRLHHLCRGECYNPGDERKRITRIEVMRVYPQVRAGEPVESLIEDPWRVFECDGDAAGCAVRFEDPDFAATGRDALYYARAIQEPSLVVNAGNLRCVRGADGECSELRPCYGDYRTDYEDDCAAPEEERAWSSPIFVNRP